jgi:hypothetical protein
MKLTIADLLRRLPNPRRWSRQFIMQDYARQITGKHLTIADLIRREGREPGGVPTIEQRIQRKRKQLGKRYGPVPFTLFRPKWKLELNPGTVFLRYPPGIQKRPGMRYVSKMRDEIKAKYHVKNFKILGPWSRA